MGRPPRHSSIQVMRERHVFYLVPASPNVGLTSVSLGLVRALDREGVPVGFFKPVRQPGENGKERSTHFLRATGPLDPPEPRPFHEAQALLKSGKESQLLHEIVEEFDVAARGQRVIVVEGLQPTGDHPDLETLNHMIFKALDAELIIVSTVSDRDGGMEIFQERTLSAANQYGGPGDSCVLGVIVNNFNAPISQLSGEHLDEHPPTLANPTQFIQRKCRIFNDQFPILGAIPWDQRFMSPRTHDMARHLGAHVIYEGEIKTRRVVDVTIIARTVKNMVYALRPNTLIITPGDRDDIIMATCMAALNDVPLAGLLLTGGDQPDAEVLKLCEKAFKTGLPLLGVNTDSYVTGASASKIDSSVAFDDIERIKGVMDFMAEHLCLGDVLLARTAITHEPRLSPPAFLHLLATMAREQPRRILLPEADDPRIIRAAAICHERNIAKCVLLGSPSEVRRLAEAQGINLPDDIEIVDPTMELRLKYVDAMVELRKHKQLNRPSALSQLEDITVLATMMLACGEVDGLVSGAVHSTANTVRPALQLIKTRPSAKLISSIFFMCLPNEVLIYGDCAINPDPNAEELADIALQSAASAESFGIEPRVAMISYSTGSSGTGSDVDKVREATRIAQERRPDLLIDGPLQYDAASTMEVARSKAPDSKVAGRATVLIFPDLNTGNTTYKAVQRTANVVAVGPMLQGLRRPVNDLSRGALVEDIVYTIALTAIQAE
jgi:phosphate acetyltransferase